ncbi:MAG: histidine kinase [Verrucomicrobia bacterium]|jgi:signal transduction histidine kinase|nr:histidine kinase [Verrucomicrobiota bacterium]
MKRELKTLLQAYQAALHKHLSRGPGASLRPAHDLGSQAAALKLETLDLARIHEVALAALAASGNSKGLIKRAKAFFAEAITPIEKTHRSALKAHVRLRNLSRMLARRTLDLATSQESLKQGVLQRQAVQESLKKSELHSQKLLQESLRLQKHLQRLTHSLLLAQEEKRKKISRELHDEIAQTLLGINVRLLTLKQEAAVNACALKKEIASTQRLVDISIQSIQRFAREIRTDKPT